MITWTHRWTFLSFRLTASSAEILGLCRHHKDHLLASFPQHFSGSFEPTFYDDWLWTLEYVVAVAKERTVCHWTMPLLPGDHNYGRPWPEVAAEMQAGLDALAKRLRGKRWWQFWK